MIIFFGCYRWLAKTVGFRHDYCRNCDSQTLAIQVRKLYVGHIFWVPLLPLGLWRNWHCTQCDNPPHKVVESGFAVWVATAVVCALFGWAIWLPDLEGESNFFWVLRFALPLGMVLSTWAAIRHFSKDPLKERLAQVEPFSGEDCLVCGEKLAYNPPSQCLSCGASHKPLKTRPR